MVPRSIPWLNRLCCKFCHSSHISDQASSHTPTTPKKRHCALNICLMWFGFLPINFASSLFVSPEHMTLRQGSKSEENMLMGLWLDIFILNALANKSWQVTECIFLSVADYQKNVMLFFYILYSQLYSCEKGT